MPAETSVRGFRIRDEDWEAFRRLQFQLERQLPPEAGRLTQADVFKLCVSSATAVAASGQVPHGWPPRQYPDG